MYMYMQVVNLTFVLLGFKSYVHTCHMEKRSIFYPRNLNLKDLSMISFFLVIDNRPRTCWIYNLCGSIRIYKDKINIIDPYADL